MKRVHIYIPESLEQDIRSFIATTYHRYEGGQLSTVVIQALRMYLDPGTHTKAKFEILKSQTRCPDDTD